MDRDALAPRIDHTVLGPETTPAAVRAALDEAAAAGMNACVPPCHVPLAADHAPGVTLVTVVGFPHGTHAPATKRGEAVDAWRAGADELDVVANVGRVLAGEVDAVREELESVVAAVPVPVKVIVEAPLLDDAALGRACAAARDAGAAMLKTATGFADSEVQGTSGNRTKSGDVGATVADVELMSEYLPVKASGGVGDYATAMAMLDAGAERIGASSGPAILAGAPDGPDGTDA